MKTLLAAAAAAAVTFACAAAPAAADPAAADDIRVKWNDLDLSTPAGVATLHRRTARAARQHCLFTGSRIPDQRCIRAVQRAVTEQLPVDAQRDYAHGRRREH